MIQTFSTGSRRLAPLTARGPAPGRACAPVYAPLQPGRRPRRAHSNQPPDAREGGASWLGRSVTKRQALGSLLHSKECGVSGRALTCTLTNPGVPLNT
jgi:hypothetical protein